MHACQVGVRGKSAVDALLDVGRLDLILVARRQQARYASAKFSMISNCLCPSLVGFKRLSPSWHAVRRIVDGQKKWLSIDRHAADDLGRSIDRIPQIGIVGAKIEC